MISVAEIIILGATVSLASPGEAAGGHFEADRR